MGVPGDALETEGGVPQSMAAWIKQSKWTSLTHSDSSSRVQAGSGSQFPLARQVIMTDPEILNPLLQE